MDAFDELLALVVTVGWFVLSLLRR